MRIVKGLAFLGLVAILVVAIAARRPARRGHRPGAAPGIRDGAGARAGRRRQRRSGRGRDRPHHGRHAARPVLRPGLRARQRADVADGGLAARLGRAAGRAVRREPARHRPVHPDARLAGRRAARPRRLRAGHPGRPGCLHRGRQRLAGRPPRLAGAGVPRQRRHARTVDGPRHRRLEQGPGLEPGRQLRHRGLPLPRRRDPRRPGPDRRALPGLPPGRAGDHADRPARIGRRGRQRHGAARARTGQASRIGHRRRGDTGGRRTPGRRTGRGLAVGRRARAGGPPDRRSRRRGRARLGPRDRLERLGRGAVDVGRPAAPCWPTTRTSASRCRPSGT